ncbi:hypothetical protein LVJ94_49030 [Pendulispora rubella]|uniref:Uncharacterized protein n=1 Tax=Pendulispora rubella TaxID=2741070 RepID=A0ABZ2L6H2_9BACT
MRKVLHARGTKGAIPAIGCPARLDDGAAIAFTRSSCPSATKPISPRREEITDGSSDLAEELVCARLRGVSPKKIVQAWDAICQDVDPEDPRPCQTWPKDIAAVTPPFNLR